MSEEKARLLDTLQAYLGRQSRPLAGRDPVNLPTIRNWCDAMEDQNPVYTDPAFAGQSVHGAIVAPPTMLFSWTMPGNIPVSSDADNPQLQMVRALAEAGYTSPIATNADYEFLRPLRLGDLLSSVQSVRDISPEKQTGLGAGHFLNMVTEYFDQHGELVGRASLRVLVFKPGTGRAAPNAEAAAPTASQGPDAAPAPRPPRRQTTLRFDAITVGDELPPCSIPITTTLIVAGALASRDFTDVHHDPAAAKRVGSPDVYMNILTTGGLCGRYVSDWAGPEAVMRSLKIRLGLPNYPHDTMTMSGSVIAKRTENATDLIEVGLSGRNSRGDHVTGSTVIELPRKRGA